VAEVVGREDKAHDAFVEQYSRILSDTPLDLCFTESFLERVSVPEFDKIIHVKKEVPKQTTVEGGRRYNFAPHIADILKAWLVAHQDRPYPNDAEKQSLASSTGLTVEQIKYWFINARRRLLPKIKQEQGFKSRHDNSYFHYSNKHTRTQETA